MRARIFLFAALVFVAGCRRESATAVFVDPALAVLVPPDTVLLAGVRMGKLAETPFWTRFVAGKQWPAVERFHRETGLDLRKDLWEILLASDGKDTVVLLRGKFSDRGFEPELKRPGSLRMSYKGYTMLGDEQTAVVFMNPTTAAAGPTPALRRIVDRRDDVAGIPKSLEDRIKKIPANHQMWFAGNWSGQAPKLGSDLPLGTAMQMLRAIGFVSGAADVRQAFRSYILLETANERDAEQLRGALRAVLGLGRLNTPEDRREMLSVYDGMQVMREGSVVRFGTDIPFDMLERTADAWLKFGAPSLR